MVTIYTTCLNIKEIYISPSTTEWPLVFRVILTINIEYFPKRID
jgi:hypothetical protein